MSQPIHLTEVEFNTLVLKSEKPVVVDFWAPWCSPCRALVPILEEYAEEIGDRVLVAKVNVDDYPDLTAKFGIRSIPALLVFKEGEIAASHIGTLTTAALRALVEPHLD